MFKRWFGQKPDEELWYPSTLKSMTQQHLKLRSCYYRRDDGGLDLRLDWGRDAQIAVSAHVVDLAIKDDPERLPEREVKFVVDNAMRELAKQILKELGQGES